MGKINKVKKFKKWDDDFGQNQNNFKKSPKKDKKANKSSSLRGTKSFNTYDDWSNDD